MMLLLALCVCNGLQAQTAVDGAISGTVSDQTGAVIPSAAIEATSLATGSMQRAQADGRGFYRLERLAPGSWRVVIRAPGFATSTSSAVEARVGHTTELNAKLALAAAGATVTVSAAAEGELSRQSGAFASDITQNEIENLPSHGERWSTFAALAPGANTSDSGRVSFRGISPLMNNNTVDGGNDNQAFSSEGEGRGQGQYSISQYSVREFRVNTASYSAQYGGAAGGVVNTVTRSGSNVLRGTLFGYREDSDWGASNPFTLRNVYHKATGITTVEAVKPRQIRDQYGAAVGGPLLRDRLFFFYSFDGLHRSYPFVSSPSSPSFLMLTANQLALLANRGVRQSQIDAAMLYLTGLTGVAARTADQTIHFPKLDWQIGERNHLSAQYNRMRSGAPAGSLITPVVNYAATSLGNRFLKIDSAQARWLTFMTENITSELRYQHGRDLAYETAQTPAVGEPNTGPDGLPPQVQIGIGGLTFGTPASVLSRSYPNEHREQGTETITWVHGSHMITAGVDYSHVHDVINALRDQEGAYRYDKLEDWITDYIFSASAYPNGGCPSIFSQPHSFCFTSYSQGFGPGFVSFSTGDYAGFVQDDWKLIPSLTLNLGMRYEYEQLPAAQHPNPALDAAFGHVGSTSRLPSDRNNFAPRFGFAWSPRSLRRTVLRGGYGLYYGRMINATIESALLDTAVLDPRTNLPASNFLIRVTPKTTTSSPTCVNSGIAMFGYPCTFPAYPAGIAAKTTGAVIFDRGFRAPMIQEGDFSVEQEVGKKTVLTASYLMSEDRQLPNFVDINIAPSTGTQTFSIQGGPAKNGTLTGETFVLPVYTSRINTNYGAVTDIRSNVSGSYNALVVEVRRRMDHGIQFRFNWTWSKALDFGQNGTIGYARSDQLDPFQIRYDRSLSNYNFPHKFVVTMLAAPQFHMENRTLRVLANGWEVAPIFVDVSGRPYSFNITGGPHLLGGHRSINGSGGARYLPTVGRNTMRLPDTANLDLRLSRTLRFGRQFGLEAFGEAFNLLNRENYSGLNTTAYLVGATEHGVTQLLYQDASRSGTPFGQFSSAGTSVYRERQVQIALRLHF